MRVAQLVRASARPKVDGSIPSPAVLMLDSSVGRALEKLKVACSIQAPRALCAHSSVGRAFDVMSRKVAGSSPAGRLENLNICPDSSVIERYNKSQFWTHSLESAQGRRIGGLYRSGGLIPPQGFCASSSLEERQS